MADIRVEKCYFNLDSGMDRWGFLSSAEVPFLVFGAETEQDALTAVYNASQANFENLKRDALEIEERISDDVFKVRVSYVRDEFSSGQTSGSETAEPTFSFDTGGGTKHLTQSRKTISKTPANAADFGGAIEVDGEGNVNGVDVTMPVMNFSETHYLRASKVTTNYKKKLAELTGSVNSGKFKGYDPGEVLFLGASGSRRGNNAQDNWEITFRFAVSPNEKNLKIGSLTVPEKLGWDYAWVRYANDVSTDQKSLVRKPIAVYVERVYSFKDFGGLGI